MRYPMEKILSVISRCRLFCRQGTVGANPCVRSGGSVQDILGQAHGLAPNLYRKSARRAAAVLIALLATATAGQAEIVGEVSTTFKLLGANDKIVIEAFDDPDIKGATCYLSRAKTGGIRGTVGLAEDKSDASLACRQTGPIILPKDVVDGKSNGDRVFRKSTSILFKKLQVVRFYDPKRNTLIYLTYSDKIIDGSPKNSISTIVVRPWGQEKKAEEKKEQKQ